MNLHLPILYIVSDSLGETAELVARAAASQFNDGQFVLKRVSHVHDVDTINEVVVSAQRDRAIIAFTIVVPELREHLVSQSTSLRVRAVDVLTPMLEALESATGTPPQYRAGLLHQLDEDYFRRMDAVEFAVKCDDGRNTVSSLGQADAVLIGVSRTSKTPLSMYLAHKRFKVVNVPLVPEITPPEELFLLPYRKKIIGLTIRPDKLNLIRKERLRSMGLMEGSSYSNYDRILQELAYSDATMKRLGCPVIDVSDKAVEETASLIIEYLYQ